MQLAKNTGYMMLISLIFGGLLNPTIARSESPALWPCAQRYIDTIYPDVYWPAAASSTSTIDSDAIDAAVRGLSGEQPVQAMSALLDAVVKAHGKERNAALYAVFNRSAANLNITRQKYLKGILRHAEGQSRLAQSLEQSLNRLDQHEAGELSLSSEAVSQLHQEIQWQQRQFQNRNDQIIVLCELPVDIEERVADIAHALKARVD